MKTKVMYLATKFTVAVILVAIIAVKALASGTPELKLVPHSDEKAVIAVDFSDAISELIIEDVTGNIVYFKEGRIEKQLYSKVFDFKNLDDGEYKIIAKNKFGKSELVFSVLNNKIKADSKELVVEPFIEVKDNVLKLSFLNHNKSDIRFSIANNEGIVFNKKLGSEFNITSGFNINKLAEGNYTANISDGVNNFSYSFEK